MESTLTLELTRLNAPLGAEVHGVDAREVPTPEVVHALKQAVAEHGVLVMRGQQLGDEAHQVAFTEAFGETVIPWLHGDERGLFYRRHEIPPRPGYSGWHPSCNYMVNSPDLWDNPDDGFAEDWHADVSYLQSPMPYSFLFALEAPDQGYQTWYTNQYAVYDSLDPATQRQVNRLKIPHFFKSAFPRMAGAVHPVAPKHPRTGRRAIYGLPGYAVGVPIGMAQAEGEALMQRLGQHIADETYLYKHVWSPGDFVIWDNRVVLHRRGPQIKGQTRILRRTVAFDGTHEEVRRHLMGY